MANEKPEVLAEAEVIYQEILLNYNLSKLCEKMNKTQVEMANALGIKQPTVTGMEKEGRDIKLSSLKRYAEAPGYKLNLDIELPEATRFGFKL